MNPPPVGTAFMSPGPAMDPRHIDEDVGLDVGMEPGAGLGYPLEGDIRIISREIYQGKTFDDWDDMEANVRRLARKAGFKVVKVSEKKEAVHHARQRGCVTTAPSVPTSPSGRGELLSLYPENNRKNDSSNP